MTDATVSVLPGARPVRSSLRRTLRQVVARPTGMAALVWLAGIVFVAVAAPAIAPSGPLGQNLSDVLATPSARHLLGTDELGRDVLSRLIYGGRPTLLGVAEALAAFLVIGISAGVCAGYFESVTDLVLSRLADLAFSLPTIIIVLVVLSVFTNNSNAAMVTVGVLGSPYLFRIVRASTLSIREELYIDSARVSGLTGWRILQRHILPRLTGTIIVQSSLFAGVALVTEASLNFLGFGVQPPNPSWGGMVYEAAQQVDRQSWLLVPAGGAIALTVLAFGLLGDAARDASVGAWSEQKLGQRRRAGTPGDAAVQPAEQVGPADTPATGALLSVRGMSVTFRTPLGPVTAVTGVSFDVFPGESVGIIGESGCGKSVTAMGVLGLVPGTGFVSGGACLYQGRDLLSMSDRELAAIRGREIAFVSSEPLVSLDPTFTVGSQLAEAVRRHSGVSRRQARTRAIELLEMVRMPAPPAVARRYPYQLSGGMAQRVAIALALAGNPKLLIADEPTTALDVTVQAEILELLRTLQHETGMAIVLITHDCGVVADLCQRAIVMYAGQVVESAEVAALFGRPLHPYTEGLLESNPHWAEPGKKLYAIPGAVPEPAAWPVGCHFQARCPHMVPECAAAPIAIRAAAPDHLSRCIRTDEMAGTGSSR